MSSETEQIALVFVDSDKAKTISQWTTYRFNSNFLTPTDGWSFTIGTEDLDAAARALLQVGSRVRLSVNGLTQSDGFIDSVEIRASRSSGVEYVVEGRDRLAQVVDACADPTQTLKESQTLAQALQMLFGPFGWPKETDYEPDNVTSRNIKTGGMRSAPTSKKGKPLKSYALHQLRPHAREGVFEFASRIAQRFGLWIWCSADGTKIIVAKPDFEQKPAYTLRRAPGITNVLDGSVKFDVTDQPTIIIADGYSGGGEFGKGSIKAIMANTAVYTRDPAYSQLFEKYHPSPAQNILGHAFPHPVEVPRNRTLYLHDDESKTQEQLNNFVRREMALLQRKSLTAHYEVEGHGQMVKGAFVPWTVDTVVAVEDTVAGFQESLYVLGRTFSKSRGAGTTTQLELVRLHTIEFGEPINPAARASSKAPVMQARISSGEDPARVLEESR